MYREEEIAQHDMARELQRIRDSCGTPTYKVICALSSKFSFGGNTEVRLPLARATVGNLFSKKRSRLPRWEKAIPALWACYQYAKEKNRMPSVDPAAASQAAWNKMVEIANRTPTLHDEHKDSDEPLAVPSGTAILYREVPALPLLENFSAEQRWYFNTYGQLGAELFRAAKAGESEAAYRLGVVMTVDRHPRKARNWLAAAMEKSHAGASELLASAPGSRAGQVLATEHAYQLGYAAHHGIGDKDQAIFYYKHAARQEHSDAAYHLGHIYAAAGESGNAARWFSIAVRGENLDAKRQLQKLKVRRK